MILEVYLKAVDAVVFFAIIIIWVQTILLLMNIEIGYKYEVYRHFSILLNVWFYELAVFARTSLGIYYMSYSYDAILAIVNLRWLRTCQRQLSKLHAWIRFLPLILIRLLLFLLIRNSPCFSLTFPHFTKVNPNGTAGERVSLRGPTILFIGSS